MSPSVRGALLRYRLIAYVVGVVLLVLVLVAMPLKYAGDEPRLVELIGPVHGFLYMGYLALAAMLCLKMRWSPGRTALVLLAGTVPFLSFVVERRVTRQVRAQEPLPT